MTSPNEEQKYVDELIQEVAALELDEKSRPLLNLTLRLIEQSLVDGQTIKDLHHVCRKQATRVGDIYDKLTEALAHLQDAHNGRDPLGEKASKSISAATFALTKAISKIR